MSWDGVLILAQQQGPDGGGVANAIGAVIYLAIVITMFAGLWKTFEKAGEPGWGVLIPFYNIYLLCKIAGRPGWWLLLLLIPCVNFIVGIIIGLDIAKNFGKGTMFGIGLASWRSSSTRSWASVTRELSRQESVQRVGLLRASPL